MGGSDRSGAAAEQPQRRTKQPAVTEAVRRRAEAVGATPEDVAKVAQLEQQLVQLQMMGFGVRINGSLLRGE